MKGFQLLVISTIPCVSPISHTYAKQQWQGGLSGPWQWRGWPSIPLELKKKLHIHKNSTKFKSWDSLDRSIQGILFTFTQMLLVSLSENVEPLPCGAHWAKIGWFPLYVSWTPVMNNGSDFIPGRSAQRGWRMETLVALPPRPCPHPFLWHSPVCYRGHCQTYF